MRSALRTFTSALGVCAACYLLSTASWQQVLLLFLVASFGWTWWAFSSGLEADGTAFSPRTTPFRKSPLEDKPLPVAPDGSTATAMLSSVPVMPEQRLQLARESQPVARVQRVYRFPIHELTRASLTPAID
jgi:hypothetical protein